MNNSLRTFIAVQLDPLIQRTIRQIQDEFRKLNCDVRWVKAENTHLTLKFLGSTPLSQLDAIQEILKKAGYRTQSFSISLDHLGAFPNWERPSVLWMGVKDESRGIQSLWNRLENDLLTLGFAREKRELDPHITIGRVKSLRNISILSELAKNFQLPHPLEQAVKSVAFFKSTLTPSGPEYKIISKCDFYEKQD